MIFNDFDFLLLFLPGLLALFFMPGLSALRLPLLIAASFLFYGLSGVEHALLLAIDILWIYGITRINGYSERPWLLWIAVCGPALSLIYYKYTGFILSNFIDLETTSENRFSLFKNILLPAGISFFTFQLIAFAVDRYKQTITTPPSLGQLALYVSFFPQLVAGPIVRYEQVEKAIQQLRTFKLSGSLASTAIAYLCFGLAIKVLGADSLGNRIEGFISSPGELSSLTALFVVLAYSFQIYFDFWGYSLAAIGLGRFFGFHLPQNFFQPYLAPNPKEFWRRWHMTLSYWIRDYLYLNLGGNRSHNRNILIVFIVCGLWHGAGWSFVIWGLYHAILVLGYQGLSPLWDRFPLWLGRLLTFTLVSLGWIFFMFDFSQIPAFMASLAGNAETISIAAPDIEAWGYLLITAVIGLTVPFEFIAEQTKGSALRSWSKTIGFAVLALTVMLFINESKTFIYFRF